VDITRLFVAVDTHEYRAHSPSGLVEFLEIEE
jgi:hypothetical protein